jgi:hypothetical protein
MTTTLTNRSITGFTAKYFWQDSKVKIIIDCNNAHNIIGEVKAFLNNCDVVAIEGETYISDFFNGEKKFTAKTTKILETDYFDCKNGLAVKNVATNITGSSITFAIANTTYDLSSGTYTFKLTNDTASIFDNSKISIQEKNLISLLDKSYNGKFDTYAEVSGTNESIDNQELTFESNATLSVIDSGTNTNIQLIIKKND